MKKIFFFILLLVVFSCDIEKRTLYGDCSDRDYFKFSSTKAIVSSEGSKIVITSGEEYWVIYCVVFDGKSYQCERCMEKGINEYASRDGVTQYCDNIYLKNPNSLETTRIEAPWFTIIKETPKKLVFEIDPNHSGEDRTFWLGIEGGDCHTVIDIEQSAK